MASSAIGSKERCDDSADDDRIDTGVRVRADHFADAWHLRCTRRAPDGSTSPRLPDVVTVLLDGTAIVHYPGEGSLRFSDLAHVMVHHDLGMRDFEEDGFTCGQGTGAHAK